MCEHCKTGTVIDGPMQFNEYKFCPFCGNIVNRTVYLYEMSESGSIKSMSTSTSREVFKELNGKNIDVKYVSCRPNFIDESYSVGDVLVCEDEVYVITY